MATKKMTKRQREKAMKSITAQRDAAFRKANDDKAVIVSAASAYASAAYKHAWAIYDKARERLG